MVQIMGVILAALLMLAPPPGTKAADLVVWWEEGWYPEEEAAVAELIAAFEHQAGTKVELVRLPTGASEEVKAALAAGQPPDFLWGLGGTTNGADQWAYEDRLVDLAETLGPLRELFDPDLLERATLLNGHGGESGLYALPMGRITNHIHVWKSLLERAGFTLADVPKEWDAFWAFWCDRVQPAVRKATGREDIYGVALPMSIEASDTADELDQFLWAYTPRWPPPAGWNLVDAPATRTILLQTLERYAAIYETGCTPPDAVRWTNRDNNQAFLDQRVVMVLNPSLSIPNMLRQERPEDYSRNTATIEWPRNTFGGPLVITGSASRAVVFKEGGNPALAKQFVRYLVEDGWLAHWLDFSRDRLLPPMRRLIDQPYWLDPSDPHRMRSAMQTLTQPHSYSWWGIRPDHERRFDLAEPQIMATAVNRVAAEAWSAERAVDEAIARVKQILAE
jgi:multiple sugar transport system substrate-binding protein